MEKRRNKFATAGILLLFGSLPGLAGQQTIPLEPRYWALENARVVEQAGRKAVTGLAVLKDVIFQDGIIEFDVWAPDTRLTGSRAYPAVLFRMRSRDEAERLYIRPHRAGLYADAVQYTPVFNGLAGWQLYSGAGFTNSILFPLNEWVPVRIEVAGRQGRLGVRGFPQGGGVLGQSRFQGRPV